VVIRRRGSRHREAHRLPGAQPGGTVGSLAPPRHNFQDRGLTGTVWSDHTDLGSGEKGHGYVVENDLVAHFFACIDHLINKFGHTHYSSRLRQLNVILPPHRFHCIANTKRSWVPGLANRASPAGCHPRNHRIVVLWLWSTE